MSILRNDMSGLPDGYVNLAPVEAIRSEAEWAAKALVNSEVERAEGSFDRNSRESIEAKAAVALENKALGNSLDIYAFNERIFQARTGRMLMDDVKSEASVKSLVNNIRQSLKTQEQVRVQDMENGQRFYDDAELLDVEAGTVAEMMLDREHLASRDHNTSVSTLKSNLVSAVKFADLDLNELTVKLEAGKAYSENVQRKSQELKAYGIMRGKSETEHLNDLKAYQESAEERSTTAKFVARSVIQKESPELSGVNQSEAEAVLTEKLIGSDIKGELDLVGMKAKILEQKADLSDEIEF